MKEDKRREEKVRTITINVSDEEYRMIMAVSGRRKKSPSSLFKKIMYQLNTNDEIEEYTGKKKKLTSVIKNNREKGRKGKRK